MGKIALEKITLTVAETADLTGLSKAFIYRLVARGEIPNKKVGRLILFHRPTIEAWLRGEV
ncbi:helix-turn-helix domain-containing protein [Brevibacillus panacihumi]|uniref:helix-turn-helix domain-containing protein n=1 Tax=Brevibacillus panacihumi TaxID=497735 RepID=UPI003D0848C7